LIEERLLLVIAYVAVAVLLLCFCLYSKFTNSIKTLVVSIMFIFYLLSWQGTKQILGWPTTQIMPEEFRVLWISIDEPDKEGQQPGNIFFWVRKLDEVGFPINKPRAYSIKWTEENAEKATEALKKIEEGEILNGTLSRNILSGPKEIDEGQSYEGVTSSAGQDGEEPTFQFRKIAPPSLPPKRVLNN